MARRARRVKSFAELAAEPTWSESSEALRGEGAVRPGGVNHAGEFFAPFGSRLTLRQADASVSEAQRAVDRDALVVYVHGDVRWGGRDLG